MPTCQTKRTLIPKVPGTVAIYLFQPPRPTGFRQAEVLAILMPVPEAAMDENDGVVFWQHDVRPTWKGFVFRSIDCEAVAEPMKHRPNGKFRFRVASADAGHDLGTFLRCEDICHHGNDYPTQPRGASAVASRRLHPYERFRHFHRFS